MTNTNVKPDELNYDRYESEIYDDDIRRSIPGHVQLHESLVEAFSVYAKEHEVKKILELGIGTGLTSEKILQLVPSATLTAVDFSEQMLLGARKRLTNYNVNYVVADYSDLELGADYDVVVSVIGIHHQNDEGKRKLFKKIADCLKPGGLFLFGDLVSYRDQHKAAINDARHYHYLVENARDDQALREWAHHHKFLNLLAPMEDQIEWLKLAGFSEVTVAYEFFNTVLLVGKK